MVEDCDKAYSIIGLSIVTVLLELRQKCLPFYSVESLIKQFWSPTFTNLLHVHMLLYHKFLKTVCLDLPVVRRSGHYGLVGRPVAERGIRFIRGIPRSRS